MKEDNVESPDIPERCPKCGNRRLEVSEDGLDCWMCGRVKYLPASVIEDLTKRNRYAYIEEAARR